MPNKYREAFKYLVDKKAWLSIAIVLTFMVSPFAFVIFSLAFTYHDYNTVAGVATASVLTLFASTWLLLCAFGILRDLAESGRTVDGYNKYWADVEAAIADTKEKLDAGKIKRCPKCRGTGHCPRCKGEKYVANELEA